MKTTIATCAALLLLCACDKSESQGGPPANCDPTCWEQASEARKKQNDELNLAAKDAEAAALEIKPQLRAAFAAEQERQVAGFAFEAHRFGDFLTVFVGRLGNPEQRQSSYSEKPQRKFSTTLNLGLVREIELTQGHDADEQGELTYSCSNCQSFTENGVNSKIRPPLEGAKVAPNFPHVPYQRGSYSITQATSSYCQTSGSSTGTFSNGMICQVAPPHLGCWPSNVSSFYIGIDYTTKNYPRPAEDDTICFDGLGATISVPFGKGTEVRDAILAEVAKNR